MANENAADLELFVLTGCPFCRKVLNYMDEHSISIPIRNVSEDEGSRKRLVEVGGKLQAPCLFIDGKPLYESDDIIAWLAEHVA